MWYALSPVVSLRRVACRFAFERGINRSLHRYTSTRIVYDAVEIASGWLVRAMMGCLILMASMLLAPVQPAPYKEPTLQVCAKTLGATAIVHRLADLPPSVRDDLLSRIKAIGGNLADSDVPILQTDAPGPKETSYAHERFEQAVLVGDIWFVQLRIAMTPGVNTLAYRRERDGKLTYLPNHNFGGPACASIKAALSGVTTVDGL